MNTKSIAPTLDAKNVGAKNINNARVIDTYIMPKSQALCLKCRYFRHVQRQRKVRYFCIFTGEKLISNALSCDFFQGGIYE